MKGSVEITKVFKDGTEECVCIDHNILTDGLGVGLCNIFTDKGSTSLSDHIVGYFQIGLGRLNPDDHVAAGNAKYISTLNNPLILEDDYGKDSEIRINTHEILRYHPANFDTAFAPQYDNGVFAVLPDSHSTKVIDGVVHYRLTLTEGMANDLNSVPITEFGLFIRDGNSNIKKDQSVLVAYKQLADGSGITKTSDFSLVIDWQLKFIADDESSETTPEGARKNVVLIMIDDVGMDHLGNYDAINPYEIQNSDHANATPFSVLDDPVNGSSLYPYTPTLSAIADAGMQMFNVRAQPACSPTRATLLTGRYNFSTKNFGGTGNGFWGPGIGIVPSSDRRTRGGLRGLNDGYTFYNNVGGLQNLGNQVKDTNGVVNTITQTPVIGNFLKRPDINYQCAMFGKWHLSIWEDDVVYCETGDQGQKSRSGRGWEHIALKGFWDHYFATFSNLNANPIPGVNPISDAFIDTDAWPNNGSTEYYTGGKNMGYVNYFVTTRGTPTDEGVETWNTYTVSDSKYISFKQSSDGVTYGQGDASSYSTNYIFSAASSYYNTATEPFFMYVSPNIPHTPYTWPPSGGIYNGSGLSSINQHTLLKAGVGATDAASASWATTNAMLENFDSTLSSFLQGLDETKKSNTIFIVTSDNGALGPDIGRRAAYASSIGLGYANGATATLKGNYVGSGGLGIKYDKMLNLGAYCSSLSTSAVRRGGENDSANQFKATLYDRGMLVPMFVSGAGVSAGVSSHAMIDLTDVVATIADIAGAHALPPNDYLNIPPDSISFYSVLKGTTDASSHARQFSWGESFFPIGNSTGNASAHGSYTSSVNCGTESLELTMQGGYTPEPTVPRRRRQALTMRMTPADFIGFVPSKWTQTINYLINNDEDVPATGTTITIQPKEAIPDPSGGVWKILRPSSGKVSLGSNFAHDVQDIVWEVDGDGEYVLDANGNKIQIAMTQNLGKLYEEMYHLQSFVNFSGVDLYELNDLILEDNKGVYANHIASSLIVSAIKLPEAQGGINNGDANGGVLDNTVHYWNLARIFDALHRGFNRFYNTRTLPNTIMTAPPDDNLGEDSEE
tara:strand:- start:6394 stop:9600 length:3207 start_codon:yes stop_codon:yes gene_type:complete